MDPREKPLTEQDIADHDLLVMKQTEDERRALEAQRDQINAALAAMGGASQLAAAPAAAELSARNEARADLRYDSMAQNQGLAVLLTVFFGPLGLLYCGPGTAIIFCLCSLFTFGVGLWIFWPLSIILSLVYTSNHNAKVRASL